MGKVKAAILNGELCAVCGAHLPAKGDEQTCSDECASEYADDLSREWFGAEYGLGN